MLPISSFCPYVGLQPYDAEHRDYFFGREGDLNVLLSNLYAAPLTIVYGESGVGKSSILLASVAPSLREDPDTVVVVFREWQSSAFLDELKNACLKEVEAIHGKALDIDLNLSLDQILARASELSGCTIILLFDQFEEFFLYHPASQTSFDAELARAINRDDTDCSFLLVLREDSVAKLNDRFRTRVRNLMGNTVRLTHLDRDSAEKAIRNPLDVYNSKHQDGLETPMAIEPDLVQTILDQVRSGRVQMSALSGVGGLDNHGESVQSYDDATYIETPFLQLVMTRLWEEEMAVGSPLLRLETLERLGNAENIVRTHLDRSMTNLAENEQDICARFFDRLVTPNGNKIACSADELSLWSNLPPDDEHVNSLLISLCDSRILRGISPLPGKSEHRYEIFHDVLAQAILGWRARYIAAQAKQQAEAKAAEQAAQAAAQAAERERQAHLERFAEVEHLRAEEQLRRAESEKQRKNAYAVAACVILLAAVVGVGMLYRSARQSKEEARKQTAIAETRKWTTDSMTQLTTAPRQSIESALKAVDHIYPLYQEASREDQRAGRCLEPIQEAFCQAEQALHLSTQAMARHFTLAGHTDIVTDVALNASATRLATASDDGTAKVWAIDSEQSIFSLVGHRKEVTSIALSPNEKRLATGSLDGTAKIWDASTGREIEELPHGQVITDLTFSPDGELLVTASVDGKARVWAMADLSQPAFIIPPDEAKAGPNSVITSVAFSPNGQYLATASWDERDTVKIWSIKNRLPLPSPISIDVASRIVHFDFSPDSKWLAAASLKRDDHDDGFAAVWETRTGKPVFAQLDNSGLDRTAGVNNVMFSPSGKFLITSRDTALRVWDMNSGKPVWEHPFEVHRESITRMVLAPNKKAFATASEDRTANVWRTPSQDEDNWQALKPNLIVTLPTRSVVKGFTLAVDGFRVGMYNDSTQVLRLLTAKNTLLGLEDIRVGTSISLKDNRVIGIVFSHDGNYIASAHSGGDAVVWDVEHGRRVFQTPIPHDDRPRLPVTSVIFSPNGQRLATGSADGVVKVWAWQSGTTSPAFETPNGTPNASGHKGQITSMAFDADGHYLATASVDQRAMVWNLQTGEQVFDTSPEQEGHTAAILSVAMTSDASQLATASLDKTAKVWDWKSKRLLYTLVGHRDAVRSIAFSPNGLLLVSGSDDQTVNVWSTATGSSDSPSDQIPLLTLSSHNRPVLGVTFSPDGQYFASSSDQVVRAYPANIETLREHAKELLGKSINKEKMSEK